MDLIPSFSVDHTRIVPGIFTSRTDTLGDQTVTTYDVRLTRPNIEPGVDAAAMHSLEHLIATFLRNDPDWKNQVIYWGPMGCMTGFYLILKGGREPREIFDLILRSFLSCTTSVWPNGMPAGSLPICRRTRTIRRSSPILERSGL